MPAQDSLDGKETPHDRGKARSRQPATPAAAITTWDRARKSVAHKRLLTQRLTMPGLAPAAS